ncbi:MAG: ribonuclease PH [Acidimicrobiia bacterium]|nr:ribonuclease PH [Acidimicrobiia bacterium]MDH4308566.1 ribonuclease PH [Acidimicrobiia bacterium]
MPRDRAPDELRPVRLHLGYTQATPGSVLIEMGRTRVLCTASVDEDQPRWLRDSGKGWVTAEYAMLPGSSSERIRRDSYTKGRQQEISRLIGRALRAAVDLKALNERVIRVDCDVIEADGGTRTAAITGAWVALWDACQWGLDRSFFARNPIVDHVAATSVGIVDGVTLLDLEYESDAAAEVDMNVVMSGSGGLIEVQGTAEGSVFDRADLDRMLDLAGAGIGELIDMQKQATE